MKVTAVKLSLVCVSLIVMSLMWVGVNDARVRQENMVGLWPFDEGGGDTANDSSGNKNHGKLMGDTRWVNGKFGTALEFDGDMDYVEVLHDASLDITKELTIVAWAKFEEIPSRENVMIDKGPKLAQAQYYMAYEPAEEAYFLNFNGQRWHAGDNFNSPKTKDTDWHHIAVTFDTASGKIKACVDGVCEEHQTDDFLVDKGEDNLLRISERESRFSIDLLCLRNDGKTPRDEEYNKYLEDAPKRKFAVSPSGKLTTVWGNIKRPSS